MRLTKKPYESVDDVLLEIIPKLRLHNLLNPCFRADFEVFSHTASSKSAIPIPQEDCWNKQMRNLILGAGTQSSSNTGMPDFVCELNETTHVIFDNMLVTRQSDLEDHIGRFCKTGPSAYQPTAKKGVTTLRGLVIIGSPPSKVTAFMQKAKLSETNADLRIMGLCPLSGYKRFCFITRRARTGDFAQFTIYADSVPRRLVRGNIVIGQRMQIINSSEELHAVKRKRERKCFLSVSVIGVVSNFYLTCVCCSV